MSLPKKTKLIANIFKRFSEMFTPKNNIVHPEPSSLPPPIQLKIPRVTITKPNKITPFYEETEKLNSQTTQIIPKRKPSFSVKASFLFNSLKKYNNAEDNYEIDNDGVFNYKDKQEKMELFDQLKQILYKDDNEEDYKLAKIMKNDAEENLEIELGMYDLFEKEAEKFEKLAIEHSCLYVQKKSPFELLQLYADSFPCLDFRKSLLYIQRFISYQCATIIKNKYFKNFMFLVIILNSIMMTMEDPGKEVQDVVYSEMENMFLVIYTIEMVLKIFGKGFFWGKHSYLRDPWSLFDFIINITCFLPLIFSAQVDSFKFSSFRILRPLRTISSIKVLKIIILTLASAFPLLLDILMILSFFFLIFAITGTHLFSDLLKNRCFEPESGIVNPEQILCGYDSCEEPMVCGKLIENPFYNVMNFDNILYSLIMVFQCITLQAWSGIMFSVVRVFNPWSEIYFILIVIFGAFFLLNLTLAVIKTKFTDTQRVKMVKTVKNNKETEMDVIDLKRFKKIERTHFKRMKIDVEGIGASKENHSKMGELKWDDLLELKERFKEEKEREEADQKFREEREDNFRNEERMVSYMKKIKEKKLISFANYLNRLSLKKNQFESTRKSKDLKLNFDNFGLQSKQASFLRPEEESQEIEEVNKLGELASNHKSSFKVIPDTEVLNFDDLKAVPRKSKRKSSISNNILELANIRQSIRNSILLRTSILQLPNIKEETDSDDSNLLSFNETIKSPKSSILNDSDFNNSFTLKKCKLFELKEPDAKTTSIEFKNNLTPLNFENFNSISENPLLSPTLINTNQNNNFLTAITNPSLLNETSTNTLVVRKSILKNPVFSSGSKKNIVLDINKAKLLVPTEKKFIEKFSPKTWFDNSLKVMKKVKRNNIRYYKLMVDSNKEIVNYSQEDVMEYRIENMKKTKELQEMETIQNSKYKIIHKLKPPFKNPDVLKYLSNMRKNHSKIAVTKIPLMKTRTRLCLEKKPFKKLFRTYTNINLLNIYPCSPKLAIRKVKKNAKNILKPLMDPDFNYANMKKKIDQRIINTKLDEILSSFKNEIEYYDIQLADITKKIKSQHIWSGQEVLSFRLFDGLWTRKKINKILKALSSKSQDKLIWLTGIDGYLKILDKKLKLFIESRLFSNYILLIVIGNTITLSLNGLIDSSNDEILRNWNIFFVSMFTFEMILKIVCYRIKSYLRDKINIFDSLLVILSIIEICILQATNASSNTINTLSSFRVLRVIRILRSLKFMKTIVNVMRRAVKSFMYIFLLLFLFLFIYSLLGMNLFSGAFKDLKLDYRENFNSYNNAIISVFQLLSNSAWQHILYLTMNSEVNKFISALYLFSWILIGNFVFLNLFLAIILDEFYKESENSLKNVEEDFEEVLIKQRIEEKNNNNNSNESEDTISSTIKQPPKIPKFQEFAQKIIKFNYFGDTMQFMIIISCLILILETYIYEEKSVFIMNIFDNLLNAIFFIEFLLKITANGAFFNKDSYFRNNWNIMDFIILLLSSIDSIWRTLNLSYNKIIGIMKISRSFRFVSHNINMKIVVSALIDSISSIIHVIFVIFFVWLIFGIIGIALLSGRMGYCEGVKDYYLINIQQCEEIGKEWKIFYTNFDNIINSMVTLFIIASRELWPDIMYLCVDSNEKEFGPKQDNYIYIMYYFVIFILIGSYFLMNLFVGVIFFHFTQAQKNEQSKSSIFLTQNQIKWLNIQKMIAQAKPDFISTTKPKNKFKLVFYNILHNKIFKNFMNLLIFLNLIILSMKHSGSSQIYDYTLTNINFTMVLLFFLEFIMKIFVVGLIRYLDYNWNRFDVLINIITFIEAMLTNLSIFNKNSKIGNFFHALSVLRIFRLIPLFKGVEKILENLSYAVPSFINVGGLLLIIFFFYAETGVLLFSDIHEGEIIDEYNNFKNFGSALIILFKCASGDEWFHIMFDLYPNKNGGAVVSALFFITFVTLCSYIMINVFILIIIQQFEEYQIEERNPIQTFRENLENFRKIWAEFAVGNNDSVFINQKNLIDFYMKLEPPLGFCGNGERAKVALEIMKMKLEGDEDGNLYFNELLFASMKRIFGPELLENVSSEIQSLLQREERKIRSRMEKKKSKMSHKQSFIASFLESASRKPSQRHIQIKRHSVNPIITILFVGMALKTWKRFAQRKINGELLLNDSLPFVEEEEDSYEDESQESLSQSSSSSSSMNSYSFESDPNRKIRANTIRKSLGIIHENEAQESENSQNHKRRYVDGDESENDSSSFSSGSSMKSIDVETSKKINFQKGRRIQRFSQIDLIKGFLWNKLEGLKDLKRSSNMFVNFLSLHSNIKKSMTMSVREMQRNKQKKESIDLKMSRTSN